MDDEKLLATVRTLVRKLADAGATPEVIAFAVEAMETAVEAARAIGQRYQASPVPQIRRERRHKALRGVLLVTLRITLRRRYSPLPLPLKKNCPPTPPL